MDMQKRRDEMLAKRAKLEELRRSRLEREAAKSSRLSGVPTPLQGASTPSRTENRQQLDDLINSLVDKTDSGRGSRAGSPAARASRPSSMFGAGTDASDTSPGTPTKQPSVYTTSIATQTTPLPRSQGSPLATTENTLDFQPAVTEKPDVVTYSVGTQTNELWASGRGDDDELSDLEADSLSPSKRTSVAQKRMSRRARDREEEIRESIRREVEDELKGLRESTKAENDVNGVQQRFPARALTTEEMNAVTSSEDFLDFVDRSSKVIERALDEEYDLLADYALDGYEGLDEDEDEGYASSKGPKGRRMKEIGQFFDERWSKKRMISDIKFSPKFPELFLTTYTKNASAPQDPSGLLQVWNLHLHSRPEYTFFSSSDILTAKFSQFHPSLIVGGTYSGQVVLWDTRSRSSNPVQKTPLTGASSGGHTHPVYSLDVVGTQNANNIISCSTDGVVCGWTVDMLSQPQEYLELTAPPPSKTEDISPTCMGFPPSDPTSFLVGTEEGTIYPCHRYDRAGAKAGVDSRVRYKGHAAPVMSLDYHSPRGPLDLSDMVLTSSLDWTVKLWKVRPPSSASTATAASTSYSSALPGSGASNAQEIYNIAEFSREDVVYDARWSPHRPSVFSLVDGAGNVEVWDLLSDTEVPVTKATPSPNKKVTGVSGVYMPKSLNKVAWDEKEGKRLAVGGAGGLVTVFEVGSGLSGEGGVKNEEWTVMKRLVSKMERESRR